MPARIRGARRYPNSVALPTASHALVFLVERVRAVSGLMVEGHGGFCAFFSESQFVGTVGFSVQSLIRMVCVMFALE